MKRFIDTEIFKKTWYMDLSCAEKIAWQYIVSDCDNVGVWCPNFKLAEFIIGEKIDWEDFSNRCNGNVRILKSGKWWIVDFVDFQYGDLRDEDTINDKARKSYVKKLKHHGLWDEYQGAKEGLDRGIYAHKDKDKDKEKEKDKDKDPKPLKKNYADYVELTNDEFEKLCGKYEKGDVLKKITALDAYQTEHKAKTGKVKYRDHYKTLLNWLARDAIPKKYETVEKCAECGDIMINGECLKCLQRERASPEIAEQTFKQMKQVIRR